MAEAIEPLVVSLWSKDDSKPTAAKALGGISETTIKALVRSGEIPSFKLGGLRMVAVVDLKAYVDRLRREQGVSRD